MIIGMGGKLSGGKTITSIKFLYQQGLKGKKILSNIKLKMPEQVKYEFFSSSNFIDYVKKYYQDEYMLKRKFNNSCFLVDEIVSIISARKSGSNLNELITNFLMMCGKMSMDVIFTYQNYESQVDVRLRTILEKQGYCMRIAQNFKPLNEQERKVNVPIYILVVWQEEFGFLGKKRWVELYDPAEYYQYYDTEEVTLLDRNVYIKGGTKDISKTSIQNTL